MSITEQQTQAINRLLRAREQHDRLERELKAARLEYERAYEDVRRKVPALPVSNVVTWAPPENED